MQITIDTPYVTVQEFSRRSGLSDRSIRREIEQGHFITRPKQEGDKTTVFINMIHMAIEARRRSSLSACEHRPTPTEPDGKD